MSKNMYLYDVGGTYLYIIYTTYVMYARSYEIALV